MFKKEETLAENILRINGDEDDMQEIEKDAYDLHISQSMDIECGIQSNYDKCQTFINEYVNSMRLLGYRALTMALAINGKQIDFGEFNHSARMLAADYVASAESAFLEIENVYPMISEKVIWENRECLKIVFTLRNEYRKEYEEVYGKINDED